jgi:hypothetical protein
MNPLLINDVWLFGWNDRVDSSPNNRFLANGGGFPQRIFPCLQVFGKRGRTACPGVFRGGGDTYFSLR